VTNEIRFELGEYPPPHHVLRDMALEVEHRSDGTSSAFMPVVPALLDDTGAVRAGAIATVVDAIGGGLSAMTAAPNWIATADLTLHLVDRATSGTIEAAARVLRSGRTTVVLEVDVRNDARSIGIATMTFSVLPRRDTNPVIAREGSAPRAAMVASQPFEAPLLESLGVNVVDGTHGVLELEVTPYNVNSFGALQGGVVATVAEVAGERALRAACETPVRVTDLQITYLALVRGKVRTETTVLDASPAFGSASVVVNDVGAEARRTTTARVVATKDV
jgi:uncharacterized protein (TIGR00369 family)